MLVCANTSKWDNYRSTGKQETHWQTHLINGLTVCTLWHTLVWLRVLLVTASDCPGGVAWQRQYTLSLSFSLSLTHTYTHYPGFGWEREPGSIPMCVTLTFSLIYNAALAELLGWWLQRQCMMGRYVWDNSVGVCLVTSLGTEVVWRHRDGSFKCPLTSSQTHLFVFINQT